MKPSRKTVEKIGFRKGSRRQVQEALIKHLVQKIQSHEQSTARPRAEVPVQLEFDFGETEVRKKAKVS